MNRTVISTLGALLCVALPAAVAAQAPTPATDAPTPAVIAALPASPANLPKIDAALVGQIAANTSVLNAKLAKGVKRVAIIGCNVVFGTKTSASAKTQAGFGEPTKGRVDAVVNSSYELQEIDDAAMRAITDSVCADAAGAFKAAGLDVVPAATVTSHPDFARFQAAGKPTPYEWTNSGSKYKVMSPAGFGMTGTTYISTWDTFGLASKGMSGEGNPAQIRGGLVKSLDAALADINIMVDFAKQESNNAKGFFGKLAGNSEAKVESKVSLSVSAFVQFQTKEDLYCAGELCYVSPTPSNLRVLTKEPIAAKRDVVVKITDLKTNLNRADEVAANVLGVLVALAGKSGGTSTSVEKWGVVVDPTAYATAVREISSGFLAASVDALRK